MSTLNCNFCKTPLTPESALTYVDSSNERVTRNSGLWCQACYTARFGRRVEIITEADLYWRSEGVLGTHNVLLSGDLPLRDYIRRLNTIVMTPEGSRVV
jgi:hypothetical protein